MPKALDIIGEVFGKLTVLSLAGKNKHGGTMFSCLCACGKQHTVRGSSLIAGRTTSCGCSQYSGQRTRLPNGMASLRKLFGRYKRDATKRELSFELSLPLFESLTKQDCYYCGATPSSVVANKGATPYVYNGVDRLDSSLGYTESNVVPCCAVCNKMKMVLPAMDFINKSIEIAEHFNYRTKPNGS